MSEPLGIEKLALRPSKLMVTSPASFARIPRCDTSGEAEGCRLTALDVGVGVAHEDTAVGGYRDELLGEEVEIDPRHDGARVVIAGSVEGALEALQ